MTLESLESRRLFAADLKFGDFVLKGSPLFQPGGTTTLVASILNVGNISAGTFNVGFNYVDVGFSPHDEDASYDDPTAVSLTSTSVTAVGSEAAASITLSLVWPTTLAPGRYELLGKVDADSAITESNENNNTRAFGAGRALPTDGKLDVAGTEQADVITITRAVNPRRYVVDVNGDVENFSLDTVTSFNVTGLGGNDRITLIGAVRKANVNGGDGRDKIIGGSDNDTLSGGAGNDTIFGGFGADRLSGNGGNDRLFGENDADKLYGGAGNDYLDGGSSPDRLDGGAGSDILLGQGAGDTFLTKDNEVDQVFGGAGKDTATADANDILASIETTSSGSTGGNNSGGV